MKGSNIFLLYFITGCAVYIGNGISIFTEEPNNVTMSVLYILSISFFIVSAIVLLLNPITVRNVPYSGYIIFWILMMGSFLADFVITTTFINELDPDNFLSSYNTIVPLAVKSLMITILLFTDGMEVRKVVDNYKNKRVG
jgi:hypothetical protein